MKIIFIFSCSGMFRHVPACSGMFRNVSCSGFYRRPKKMAFFFACYKNKKYYAYIGQKRTMISCQIAAKWHLLSIIIEFAPTQTTSSFSFYLVRGNWHNLLLTLLNSHHLSLVVIITNTLHVFL